MVMWSEVYRPKKLEEMIGNEDARLAVLKWLSGWVNGSKPVLLLGASGVGKTTLVRVLAYHFGYDLVEMNASDTRNKEGLRARIIPILNNSSIIGRKMLLFLDEVDGISGREDTGGLDVLVELMKEPTIPVIMAANAKTTKIKELSKACRIVEFRHVSSQLLMIFLNHVAKKEHLDLNNQDKVWIVNHSQGDVRSMLNIAQSYAAGYDTDVKNYFTIDIADALNTYFSIDNLEDAIRVFAEANSSYPDPRFGISIEERRKDMINALFASIVVSNVPLESKRSMLDTISNADIAVGRAAENRLWTLLRYVNDMLAYGLYEKSRNMKIKYSQYSMGWPVMGPIFARARPISRLLVRLAPKACTSRSIFGSMVLPYLVRILSDNAVEKDVFVKALDLDESAAETLSKEIERMKGRIEPRGEDNQIGKKAK